VGSGSFRGVTIDPRTPVLVGVAQCSQRPDDPADAAEAVALMQRMVESAAADAGAPDLLRKLDLVGVVYGAWAYSDPGRLIADALGSSGARTALSFHGGNTPQSFVNAIARRIAGGELEVAVITGAETIWSRRRQRAAGVERHVTAQEGVEPDERFGADVTMSSPFEKSRGFEMPVHYYPTFESAIRASRGETIEQHRDRVAELWSRFSAVAAANPHAWRRDHLTPEQVRSADRGNRMVGFPYTKAMNSNWDLDQAAALLLCSAGAAEAAGVPRERWVFPWAGTDAHDTYLVSNRRDLHSSPAIGAAGRRLFELADVDVDDVAHIDLYSCFPSAVQVAAAELGLDLGRQLTVTGGLTFAGGPLNNYVTHSIATMADVLRTDPGSIGLCTANGGYLTKHALGLYSTEPPAGGFRWADCQDEVDRVPSVPAAEDHTGAVTVEAYTVMHGAEGPETGLFALRTPDGARTFGHATDPTLLQQVMAEEAIGRRATLTGEGRVTLG
jgi:acetyl-CoA C-acetyltransferase